MKAISRAEAPVAIEGDGVELRMQELGGGMSDGVRAPAQGRRPQARRWPDCRMTYASARTGATCSRVA